MIPGRWIPQVGKWDREGKEENLRGIHEWAVTGDNWPEPQGVSNTPSVLSHLRDEETGVWILQIQSVVSRGLAFTEYGPLTPEKAPEEAPEKALELRVAGSYSRKSSPGLRSWVLRDGFWILPASATKAIVATVEPVRLTVAGVAFKEVRDGGVNHVGCCGPL